MEKEVEISASEEFPNSWEEVKAQIQRLGDGFIDEWIKKWPRKWGRFFVPKEEINNIVTFVADVLEAKEKGKNPWVRWSERLGSFFDVVFTGPNWREREKDFWEKHINDY